MIDDVRLYGKAFGSEDVHHLFKGDPGYADYQAPRAESKRGGSGTVVKVQTPTLPAITPPLLPMALPSRTSHWAGMIPTLTN